MLGNRLDSNYETQSAISGEYLLPIPRGILGRLLLSSNRGSPGDDFSVFFNDAIIS